MRRYAFILLALIFVSSFKAQKDSLRKIRFSGVQVDVGPTNYPDYKVQSQENFQKAVKNDPYLNTDLSSYKKEQAFVFNSVFNGIVSVKGYATIKGKSKIKKEIFFGLKYGEEGNAGLFFNKTIYDTVATYTDASSGRKLYEISKKESNYNFVYTSEKISVPLGINIVTDKSKLFWISMGVELAPVVNYNYRFTSSKGNTTTKVILEQGDTLNSQYNYKMNYYSGDYTATQKTTKINGIGYGLTASLPFTLYFHPFKRTMFLKHLNLLVSVSPLYVYSYNKYFGSATGFNISMATGIRYNW